MLYSVRAFPSNRVHAAVQCVVFWLEALGWIAWDVRTGKATPTCESEEAAMKLARLRRWAA